MLRPLIQHHSMLLSHMLGAGLWTRSETLRKCRPFTNTMAAELIRSLGSSLTSVKQSNITVNNAVQASQAQAACGPCLDLPLLRAMHLSGNTHTHMHMHIACWAANTC